MDKIYSLGVTYKDLFIAKELVYYKCRFDFTNLKPENESQEYGACTFNINEKNVIYRVSKITPTKIGQFVTIWKRNKQGITQPFNVSDDIDFIIISARKNNNFGQFVFPKSVLVEKGIISTYKKVGKRGIRVYPPWDITTNKQAEKTQNWQTKYFFEIKDDNKNDIVMVKKLFAKL